MEKRKINWFVVALVIVSVIAIIALVVEVVSCENKQPIIKEVEVLIEEPPEALLDVEVINLNENFYNEEEMFYTYAISNYGDVEAKNIIVKCKILNSKYEEVNFVEHNFGNLASNSREISEVTTKNIDYSLYENGTYFCFVQSCDNCIILWKSVPELVEYYI